MAVGAACECWPDVPTEGRARKTGKLWCRTLSCGTRVTRNGQVCRVRQLIAQPPHDRATRGDDPGGLIRRQLVAPTTSFSPIGESTNRAKLGNQENLTTSCSAIRPSRICTSAAMVARSAS